ncbi:MAG: tetratricopeptide repeat protein [Acidobacteria bacterium]|nr:tetratricopeptide repeat protein [Acidobacteriota bacterium]
MSDPVIKGAKRSASRPAPHSASQRSSAKGRKLTAKSARPQPKPKRSAAKKAPARKATPVKAAKAISVKPKPKVKASRPAAKPTKPATKQPKTASPRKAPSVKARPAAAKKTKPATKQPLRKGAPKQPSRKGAHAPAAHKRTAKAAPAAKPVSRPAPPPPRKPTVDEAAALKAFERAHKEFARGHFTDARNLFRALIEQHAGVAEVTARARTYLAIAEARLRTQTSLPRDAESLYDRGVIELNRGDYVAAQEMFERAIKREPESADSHYALAATRARLGSVELALQSLEHALEFRPGLRIRAQHDPDLTSLRNEPEFERIVYSASRP